MYCELQHLLLLTSVLASFCACDRANSKRLEWQDRSNSKRLRWDEDPNSLLRRTKGERGLTFINNEAYSLSRKHQKLMWDLYLRKGYAPSLSDYDEDTPYPDLTPSSSGYRAGTATLVDPSSDMLFPSGVNMIDDYENTIGNLGNMIGDHENTVGNFGNTIGDHENTIGNFGNMIGDHENTIGNFGNMVGNQAAIRRPDIVASRILDNYELTKSPRGVPEVENEMVSNAIVMRATSDPSLTKSGPPTAADELTSKPITSATSLLSYLWDSLKDNLGELLGREMQETILNTLWSWWTSFVEFANAHGKRALEERALHLLTRT